MVTGCICDSFRAHPISASHLAVAHASSWCKLGGEGVEVGVLGGLAKQTTESKQVILHVGAVLLGVPEKLLPANLKLDGPISQENYITMPPFLLQFKGCCQWSLQGWTCCSSRRSRLA